MFYCYFLFLPFLIYLYSSIKLKWNDSMATNSWFSSCCIGIMLYFYFGSALSTEEATGAAFSPLKLVSLFAQDIKYLSKYVKNWIRGGEENKTDQETACIISNTSLVGSLSWNHKHSHKHCNKCWNNKTAHSLFSVAVLPVNFPLNMSGWIDS